MCTHTWEAVVGQGYNPLANGKAYKCKHCSATTTDETITASILNRLKAMKDGERGTIGSMLAPDQYSETDLVHICFLVSSKAKADGIYLDTGSAPGSFLHYYDSFRKREKKNIALRKVANKHGNDYDYGNDVVEEIVISFFDNIDVTASLTFCCDKKGQTQHTLTRKYKLVPDKDQIRQLLDWESKVEAAGPDYDITTKNTVDPNHYGKTVVTINDMSRLLNHNNNLFKEIEGLIGVQQYRDELQREKGHFIGEDAPGDNAIVRIKESTLHFINTLKSKLTK